MTHPSGLTAEQVEDYLYFSYTRVDGLWFVLTEENSGFEAALELDKAVWNVMPKMQARRLQKYFNLGKSLADLERGLTAKLTLDRYEFTADQTAGELSLKITKCPWHELMLKSGRAHMAERIGGVICGIEFPVFAREFECGCCGAAQDRLCHNGHPCRFVFTAPKNTMSRGDPAKHS